VVGCGAMWCSCEVWWGGCRGWEGAEVKFVPRVLTGGPTGQSIGGSARGFYRRARRRALLARRLPCQTPVLSRACAAAMPGGGGRRRAPGGGEGHLRLHLRAGKRGRPGQVPGEPRSAALSPAFVACPADACQHARMLDRPQTRATAAAAALLQPWRWIAACAPPPPALQMAACKSKLNEFQPAFITPPPPPRSSPAPARRAGHAARAARLHWPRAERGR
jgi:hypothetical protein